MKDYSEKLKKKNLCINCRSPLNHCTICAKCGNETGWFYATDRKFTEKDQFCVNHPSEKSSHHCATCDRCFCKKCIVSGGRLIAHGFQEYFICKSCEKLRGNILSNPKPSLCVFHPIGVNKESTETCADCESNICDDCIKNASRCKKCDKPLCHHECGTFRSDGLCCACHESLKWWEKFKY